MIRPPEMFAIGSRAWPGLSKLAEESGELTHVIGLIVGSEEMTLRLKEMFVEELGDVMAACLFVAETNGFTLDVSLARAGVNVLLFPNASGVQNVFVKLTQELGPVMQVIGKLMGTGGEMNHWDGSNLRERLEETVVRLYVVGLFASKVCSVEEQVEERRKKKGSIFNDWHVDGVNSGR